MTEGDNYLVISHAGSDLLEPETLDGLQEIVTQMVHLAPGFRNREQVGRFFDGLDLIEPGLVRTEEWHPVPGVDGAGKSTIWCAVGRKP